MLKSCCSQRPGSSVGGCEEVSAWKGEQRCYRILENNVHEGKRHRTTPNHGSFTGKEALVAMEKEASVDQFLGIIPSALKEVIR